MKSASLSILGVMLLSASKKRSSPNRVGFPSVLVSYEDVIKARSEGLSMHVKRIDIGQSLDLEHFTHHRDSERYQEDGEVVHYFPDHIEDLFDAISGFKNIEFINISMSKIPSYSTVGLKSELPLLKEFKVDFGAHDEMDVFLSFESDIFGKMPNLKTLVTHYVNFKSIDSISEKIEKIGISNNWSMSERRNLFSKPLWHYPNLRKLTLENSFPLIDIDILFSHVHIEVYHSSDGYMGYFSIHNSSPEVKQLFVDLYLGRKSKRDILSKVSSHNQEMFDEILNSLLKPTRYSPVSLLGVDALFESNLRRF